MTFASVTVCRPTRCPASSNTWRTSPAARLRTRTLLRACALFDISEGAGRVALSRMVSAGELVADGDGYALAGLLLDRSARQDRSAEPAVGAWKPGDGWTTAIVTGEARPAAERAALRRAAADLRLAELREGVWVRPDNLGRPNGPAADVVRAQCLTATTRFDNDEAALAARLWDLAGWDERARRLERALARSLPALDGEGQRVLAGDQLALDRAAALRDRHLTALDDHQPLGVDAQK